MPNHITNVITISDVSDERVAEILAAIKVDDVEQNSIDFNKLISMPPELNVSKGSRSHKALELYRAFHLEQAPLSAKKDFMSKTEYNNAVSALNKRYEELSNGDTEMLSFGKQLFSNVQKHGVPDWYDWSVKNWGSKWNSYGYDAPAFHDASNQIEFLTAWSSVQPILKKLSGKFPDATFGYKWADEDIGANVGEQTWQNGEIIGEHIPENHSKEAYEMAAEIKCVDLYKFL